MADNPSRARDGIGFAGLLAIAFIVLKLTHSINWAWGWVLAPLWISAALVLLVLAGIAIVALWVARK